MKEAERIALEAELRELNGRLSKNKKELEHAYTVVAFYTKTAKEIFDGIIDLASSEDYPLCKPGFEFIRIIQRGEGIIPSVCKAAMASEDAREIRRKGWEIQARINEITQQLYPDDKEDV